MVKLWPEMQCLSSFSSHFHSSKCLWTLSSPKESLAPHIWIAQSLKKDVLMRGE